jgi:hypothetical protein
MGGWSSTYAQPPPEAEPPPELPELAGGVVPPPLPPLPPQPAPRNPREITVTTSSVAVFLRECITFPTSNVLTSPSTATPPGRIATAITHTALGRMEWRQTACPARLYERVSAPFGGALGSPAAFSARTYDRIAWPSR